MVVVSIVVTILSIILSSIGVYRTAKDGLHFWQLRNIRKLLGIKHRDSILIVCSELSDPVKRQMVEEREFIYLMKYGDLDAWVEYLLSMMKIFPKATLHISSSGEALQNPLDLEQHICLIGGPDYNKMTEHFINKGLTRFVYEDVNGEIAIKDKVTKKLYYYTTIDRDFGYIEKIKNPYNSSKYIIIFGGCHTVGVTSAVKFLSAYSNGRSETSDIALNNAKYLIQKNNFDESCFVLLIEATKIGATISYPTIDDAMIFNGVDSNYEKDQSQTEDA